uniref:Uncharacterized protein n=1 Tax=Arundo donax TaxID=35708 RepID=A0A0A9DGK1_ARUDO
MFIPRHNPAALAYMCASLIDEISSILGIPQEIKNLITSFLSPSPNTLLCPSKFQLWFIRKTSTPLFRMALETSPYFELTVRNIRNLGCALITTGFPSTRPHSLTTMDLSCSTKEFILSSTVGLQKFALSKTIHSPHSMALIKSPATHSNLTGWCAARFCCKL